MHTDDAEPKNPYVLHLGGHESASLCARIALARNLKDWKLADLIDDAKLVAGELVANASKLRQPFKLTLYKQGSSVLIEVYDTSSAEPVVGNPADLDMESGRGIYIVDAVASKWGVRPERHGKTVWAIIERTSQPI